MAGQFTNSGRDAICVAVATIAQTRPVIAEIVSIDGSVELKLGEEEYRSVKTGESLQNGDSLRAKRGAKATIRCTANSVTWTLSDDGLPWGVANVCSPTKRSFNQSSASTALLRANR